MNRFIRCICSCDAGEILEKVGRRECSCDAGECGHVMQENAHVMQENGHMMQEKAHVMQEKAHVMQEEAHVMQHFLLLPHAMLSVIFYIKQWEGGVVYLSSNLLAHQSHMFTHFLCTQRPVRKHRHSTPRVRHTPTPTSVASAHIS